MATQTPSSMMDSSFKSSAASTMDSTSDLFEQMYQTMTPGLMTPLDDWTHPDLLSDFINATTASSTLPTDGNGDILVIPPQQQQQSLMQDAFLTSPCSTKDYFWTCPPPPAQDLFNALSTPSISPVMAVPDANGGGTGGMMSGSGDDQFGGLIDSLVVPCSPVFLPLPATSSSGDGSDSLASSTPSPLTDVSCSSSSSVPTLPTPPQQRKQHQPISPPLEMIMKLDPLPSCKKDASSVKRTTSPPAAAQPVACHITSASTPTFVLKQPSRKRPLTATADQDSSSSVASAATATAASNATTTSKNAAVSSELALKRQKNTDAARRSRLKKLQKMETMAARVAEMESMHHRLLARVSALEADKSHLLQKESSYVSRIQQLESDLSLAQQKLAYP